MTRTSSSAPNTESRRRGASDRPFTVALVGLDGAGKTTIATRLQESAPLPCRYLYMGQSIASSNALLPTSRLVRHLKARAAVRRRAADDEVAAPTAVARPTRKRGRLRIAASFVNRLMEAWWRQFLSWRYQRGGHVVVYDRHFLFESASAVNDRSLRRTGSVDRLEHWILGRSYPRPDLVIFLDAPLEVLQARKQEWTGKRLARWRAAIVDQGQRLGSFVSVDASRPVEQVLADVTRHILAFRATGRAGTSSRREEDLSSASAPAEERPSRPHAVVVGLDHINGLQTARILARHDVPVIAVADDPDHYCCRTRVCERIVVPDGPAEEALVETLERLGPSLGDRAVLVPCTDVHVRIISRHRHRLAAWYHVLLPAPGVVEMLMDKTQFYAWAEQRGLPVPRARFLRSRVDAEEAAGQLRFPCILKPPLSATREWQEHSPLKAYRLDTPEALLAAYDRLRDLADALIVQEWIEGPVRNLYSCNAYFDAEGKAVATFVARKLRQWPPETGESCLGEECRNDVVLDETLRLFQAVGFHGLAYLEMKQDERTGEHFIIEPNIGRPTGRSAIAEAGGVDLLHAMYCDAVGLPLPSALAQRYGTVKWIHLRRDLQSAVHAWRRGQLGLHEWWRSVRGPKAFALFCWTDPGPFVNDLTRGARLFLSSAERRKRDYRNPFPSGRKGD